MQRIAMRLRYDEMAALQGFGAWNVSRCHEARPVRHDANRPAAYETLAFLYVKEMGFQTKRPTSTSAYLHIALTKDRTGQGRCSYDEAERWSTERRSDSSIDVGLGSALYTAGGIIAS